MFILWEGSGHGRTSARTFVEVKTILFGIPDTSWHMSWSHVGHPCVRGSRVITNRVKICNASHPPHILHFAIVTCQTKPSQPGSDIEGNNLRNINVFKLDRGKNGVTLIVTRC